MNLTQDFTTEAQRKVSAAMVLPLLIAMVLNMAYNLVDSLWIGNLLGETAYAALTNATPLILILNAIAMVLPRRRHSALTGGGRRRSFSQRAPDHHVLGRGSGICARTDADPGTYTDTALAAVADTSGNLFADTQLSGDLHSRLSPVYLYCYFAAVMRSYGNSVFQVIAMLICTLLNAGLDPLFIHFMGFDGAAVATLLSQTLCLFCMLGYLHRKPLFSLHLSQFDGSLVADFIRKGIPSAFQQSIPAISTSFLTALVSSYGISALAAYGITGKLKTILFYPAMALNMALTSIVGQCAGGKRYDRAGDYIRLSLFYGVLALIVLSAAVVIFANPLSHLFVDSDAAAEIVASYFRIVGIGYVLNTVTNCFLGSLNGLGQPTKSMLCMVLYYLIVRMPLAGILSALGFGLNGIWFAVLVSHLIAAAAAAITCSHALRKMKRAIL